MKYRPAFLALFLTANIAFSAENTPVAAPAVATPDEDRDIGAQKFTPSDRLAGFIAETATEATPVISTPVAKATEPVAPAPVSKPEPAATTAKTVSAVTLPALPESVQSKVSQLGGLSFNYTGAPLDDVLRDLSRYLDRPLHVAVVGAKSVTGTWTNAKSGDVLKDVARLHGLILRETAEAFILQDSGRDLALPQAAVRDPITQPAPAARALAESLNSDLVTPVAPLPAAKLDKASVEIERTRQELLQRRAKLQR